MLELIMLWTISALALGFISLIAFLMIRQALTSFGRLVFIEPQDTVGDMNASGHSVA